MDECLRQAQWEYRLSLLRELRKDNRSNLELRYLQTYWIRCIERDLYER